MRNRFGEDPVDEGAGSFAAAHNDVQYLLVGSLIGAILLLILLSIVTLH